MWMLMSAVVVEDKEELATNTTRNSAHNWKTH